MVAPAVVVVMPVQFCVWCDERITGLAITREAWGGRGNLERRDLFFCSPQCEELDRFEGSERD